MSGISVMNGLDQTLDPLTNLLQVGFKLPQWNRLPLETYEIDYHPKERQEMKVLWRSFFILSFEHYRKMLKCLARMLDRAGIIISTFVYMGLSLLHLLSIGCLQFFYTTPSLGLRDQNKWKPRLKEEKRSLLSSRVYWRRNWRSL